ncbi:hypothetical protein BDR05DRAFT_948839 [Suillus weaverae]|nr:hypothetical protein BDR05DRAFT_948839 [Suillus weaverae]
MARWNKDQWGVQQGQGYPPFYALGGEPKPGHSQLYAQPDVRFQSKKRVNDIFFLILQFACVALSGIALSGYVSGHWLRGGGSHVGSSATLNRSYPVHNLPDARPHLYRVLMHITFVLFLILKVFRIPLASLLLQVVMDVSEHHKSIYVVAFIALTLQAALIFSNTIKFSYTLVVIYTKRTLDHLSCGNGTSRSGSTVAGLVFYVIPLDISSHQLILLRALRTRPDGSVLFYAHPAFGCLIVTIIEVVRFIMSAARNNANAQGSFVEACLDCCADFFVACIEGLVRYFDRYTYIEIGFEVSLMNRVQQQPPLGDHTIARKTIVVIGLQCSITMSTAIEAGVLSSWVSEKIPSVSCTCA